MNNKYLFLLLFSLIGLQSIAQVPSYPFVQAIDGAPLCEPGDCTTLTSVFFDTGETTSYTVTSVPYNPPFSFTGGIPLEITADDTWSDVVDLFPFCFWGNFYDKALIVSNGAITFSINGVVPGGLYTPGSGSGWAFTAAVPNPATAIPYKDAIMGVLQDINPAVAGTNPDINYQVLGAAPNRVLVFNISNVAQFGCNTSVGLQTSQMIIYETTNVIEVFVKDRTPCLTWNSGSGVIAIQNVTSSLSAVAPNRNTGTWSAHNEGWRFKPSGPSIVTIDWLDAGGNIIASDSDSVEVCPDVESTYTARATYELCNGDLVILEDEITVEMPVPFPIEEPEDELICGTEDSYFIDLAERNTEILNGLDPDIYMISVHEDQEAATEGYDAIPVGDYEVLQGQEKTFYIRIENYFTACKNFTDYTITVTEAPDSTTPADIQVCDEDGDEEETFDLTENDGTILTGQDPNEYSVIYYETEDDATNAENEIDDPENYTTDTQTIYARVTNLDNEDCFAIVSFDITVSPQPEVTAPADGFACQGIGYTLPDLAVGNYFTEPDGEGDPLDEGDVLMTSQTVYIYAESGTAPNNCTASGSFTVTIYDQPEVDEPESISACDSFVLDPLTEGQYFTESGGQGDIVDAGTEITETTTFYIYAESGANGVLCSSEHEYTVTITETPELVDATPLEVCDDNFDGFAIFNLNPAGTEVLNGQTGMVVTYHETEDGATFGGTPIQTPANYSAISSTVWIRVIPVGATSDCASVEPVELIVHARPAVPNVSDYPLCDDNNSPDGIEVFDLTTKTAQASNNNATLTVTYYTDEDLAEAGDPADAIADPAAFTIEAPTAGEVPNEQEIFVRVESDFGCASVSSFDIIVNPLPVVNPDIPVFYECEETPGQGEFFLDDIDNVVTNNTSGLTVAFYEELGDAENEAGNYISDSPYSTASKTIFARVEVAVTGCAVIVPVTLEVMPAPIADTPDPLEECDFNNDGFAFFNLDPVLEQIVTDMGNVEVSIYETEEDATFEQNVIPNTGSYQNIAINTQTLWIRVAAITGNTECFDIVQLQLIVNPVPEAVTPEPYEMCDNGVSDTDGEAIFDLTTLEAEILGTIDPALFTVTFHEDEQSAAAGTPIIPTPASYLSESTADAPIWARVTNNDTGCYDIVPVELIVNPLPVAIQPTPLTLCDDDIDDPEQEVFDLTTKIPEIILDQEGLDVTFHNSYEEADDNQNAIANPYEYVNNPPVETLFVRITNAETGCYRIVLLDVRVAPLPIIEMPTEDDLTVCDTDGNGIGEFDLQALEEAMINNGADLSIAFYETAEDAVAGENPIPNTTTYHNIVPYNQTIYVIVSNSETGCTNSIPYELNLVVTPAPQAPALEDITDCDDEDNNGQNGMAFFDLTVQDQVILDALNAAPGDLTIHYFIREDWANEGAPRITVPDHYMGSDEQTIWVRVEDPVSECYSITSFQLFLDLPLELTTPAPLAKCNEALPNDFQTVFNLREKDDEILGDLGIGQGYTVEYFESQAAVDANTPIANPEAYTNPVNPKTIFVVVTTDKGCRSYTTLTIRVLPLPVPDTTPDALELCDVNGNGDGIEVFDLTDAEGDIRNNDFSAVVTYHVSLEDAENDANAIGTPDAYTSGNGFVWVRVEAATTNAADPVCYQVVQLELKIIALPPVGANGQITPYAICELSIDGIETFYLKDYIEGILGAGADTDYDIEFYFDQAALDNGTALPAIYENEVPFTQTIVVYVQHLETGCEITAPLTLIVRQQAVANTPDDIHYCDTDGTNDGLFTPIDLTQAEAGILDGQDDTLFDVTYYLTEQDATDDVNAIADPANFTNTEADLQVLWARVTNNQSQGQCFDVTSFSVVIERLPEPEIFTTPEGDNTVCIDFDGTIAKYLELHSGVTPNGHTYEWFRNGVAITDADTASGSYMAGEGGMYSVRVTSALGCISDISEEFEVIESGQASPIGAGYFVTNAFSDEQTITVLVQGNGVYEYQLDEDGLWQTSNIFVNVAPGSHTVTVRDVKTEFACAELVLDGVSVIDYPNFFTPNGDGFHDTWNLIGLADQTDAVVYIFDRYGKLIKQISTAGEGWDGTFNGQPAVSTDYWFTVTYREFNGTNEVRKEFKSHFSLKR